MVCLRYGQYSVQRQGGGVKLALCEASRLTLTPGDYLLAYPVISIFGYVSEHLKGAQGISFPSGRRLGTFLPPLYARTAPETFRGLS